MPKAAGIFVYSDIFINKCAKNRYFDAKLLPRNTRVLP